MKWFEKFKVGQKVKVIRKATHWIYGGTSVSWNSEAMDKTIGKIYKIDFIDKSAGYRLSTGVELGFDYYYPVESLASVKVKGKQLLFNFMKE